MSKARRQGPSRLQEREALHSEPKPEIRSLANLHGQRGKNVCLGWGKGHPLLPHSMLPEDFKNLINQRIREGRGYRIRDKPN